LSEKTCATAKKEKESHFFIFIMENRQFKTQKGI